MNGSHCFNVVRRDGTRVPFDPERIRTAIAHAILKDANGKSRRPGSVDLSAAQRECVADYTERVVQALADRCKSSSVCHVEDIQDQVELVLMRAGEHDIARGYVLYRQKRQAARDAQQHGAKVTKRIHGLAGSVQWGFEDMLKWIDHSLNGVDGIDINRLAEQTWRDAFDGMNLEELQMALLLATRACIELDPAYDRAAVRILLGRMRCEVAGENVPDQIVAAEYPGFLIDSVMTGVAAKRLDHHLLEFDLERLGAAIRPARDYLFRYHGLQTLYDRYFLHVEGRRIELPQTFFMRVAMGLALNEAGKEAAAIQFYEVLSTFRFMTSTPTLFNAGTVVAQLSSCYLTTVDDDLDGIFQAVKENALLQKFAGGLGNDWSKVRAMGSHINGTNGKSQGVVPFLKVVNDTAVAVNQGGKRKGAVCSYLETWHLDIEEFLELRKNTGDDRRRTHDMNTANWIPDLFMMRVIEDGDWTLFSPEEVPDLHEKYGKQFVEAYEAYEVAAERGKIKLHKKVRAVVLWRKMLSMIFETGHPWITFKDPCNIRSPQQHVGVVHGSNLCTEITLNTSTDEIAVCNLGSVNLCAHLLRSESGVTHLDHEQLRSTVRVAMRMLDNVIDLNHYAVDKARRSNLRHRPVGLGVMGLHDCLQRMRVPFASPAAVEFSDVSQELISYFAIEASADLAAERGRYETFDGSLWSQGILPLDSFSQFVAYRGKWYGPETAEGSERLKWSELRRKVLEVGMRNSNCLAIAPTATIANIVGVSASIEPHYRNLYVKSNMSGEFTVVNENLVTELKALGLWDEVMVADLKHYEGSVQKIERVPEWIKAVYATAFEIQPLWLVEGAARRQKWIDQAQSLNLYVAAPNGRMLDEVYKLAWSRGLKTTYYLRALGATSAEKSTSAHGVLNAVRSGPASCSLDDPGCESCQ